MESSQQALSLRGPSINYVSLFGKKIGVTENA